MTGARASPEEFARLLRSALDQIARLRRDDPSARIAETSARLSGF